MEEIELRGARELKEEISKALMTCPDEMNRAIHKAANGWKKEVNQNFPTKEYGAGAKGHKPFAKSWKAKYEKGATGYIESAAVSNTHRLFHLVENGHRKVLFGKETGGFVEGKHFKDSVNKKYEDEYPELMDRAADEALKKAGF